MDGASDVAASDDNLGGGGYSLLHSFGCRFRDDAGTIIVGAIMAAVTRRVRRDELRRLFADAMTHDYCFQRGEMLEELIGGGSIFSSRGNASISSEGRAAL